MEYKEFDQAKELYLNNTIEIHYRGHGMSYIVVDDVKDMSFDGAEIRIKTSNGIIYLDIDKSVFNGALGFRATLGIETTGLLYIQLARQHVCWYISNLINYL